MAIRKPIVLRLGNILGEISEGDGLLPYMDPDTTTLSEFIQAILDAGLMEPEVVSVPVNTVAPVISGSAITPTTLSCTTGTWTNSPSSYSYQWRLDGVDVVGETASTIDIAEGDVGDYDCGVDATNAGGTSARTYSNTITVEDEAGGEPGFIGWQGPADDVTPLSDDRVWVYKVVLTETAVLDEFFIYKQTGAGGPEVKGLIFADDAGEPGDFVAGTEMVACPDGPTWFSIPISGTLSPGTYWIGLVTGGVYTPVGATSSRAGEEIKRAESYPYPGWNTAWPGTAGTVTPRSLAVYVTYNTAVSSHAPTFLTSTYNSNTTPEVTIDSTGADAILVLLSGENGDSVAPTSSAGGTFTEVASFTSTDTTYTNRTRVYVLEGFTPGAGHDIEGVGADYGTLCVFALTKGGGTLVVDQISTPPTSGGSPYTSGSIVPTVPESLALGVLSMINYSGDGSTLGVNSPFGDLVGQPMGDFWTCAGAVLDLTNDDPVTVTFTNTGAPTNNGVAIVLNLYCED